MPGGVEPFIQMLHQLREALLLSTAEGKIIAANVAGADALGASMPSLEGASLSSYVPDPALLAEWLKTGAHFPVKSSDGRRHFGNASALSTDVVLVRLSGGADIRPQVSHLFQRLSRFEEVDQPGGVRADAALRAVLADGMSSIGAFAGGVHFVDAARTRLEIRASVGYSDEAIERFRQLPLNAGIPLTHALERGAAVYLGSEAAYHAQYPQLVAAYPRMLRSALAVVPVRRGGQVVGVLGLGFPLPWTFTDSDRSCIEELADECARSLEAGPGAPLPPSGERATSRLETLHGFVGSLAAAFDQATVTEVIVDLGMAATSARTGGLWLLTDDGAAATLARSVGPTAPRPEDFPRVPLLPRGRMPILDAIGDAAPIWFESCAQLEQRYPEFFRRIGHRKEMSLACLPLVAHGRCSGGLVLVFEGERVFPPAEQSFLKVLGWHAAQAIERTRLYREAREADQRKDEFLAMLGHELRNPLAPIVSTLDTLEMRGGDAFARERSVISRHVKTLVRLVDDLLDVARITSGKIQLHTTPCQVSEVVQEAIEVAQPLMVARNHHLTVTMSARRLSVFGDRTRLTQIIGNLLTNAAKYTKPGGEISISAEEDATDVVIRVRDSGVGIAPEMLSRVFDLFVQANRSLDRAQGGLGLGLTLVKSLVTLQGGSVSAHSDGPGKGSEFIVRLPLAPEAAVPQSAPAVTPPRERLPSRPLKVLVVDDNYDAADAVADGLREFGCTVCTAYDGESALNVETDFKAELALLDIGLPGMDGHELAQKLRARGSSARLVALSGYGQQADRQRSHEAGFSEHVVKPISIEELRKIVDRHNALAAAP